MDLTPRQRRWREGQNQKYMGQIDWKTTPFTPETLPAGIFGTNSLGNIYLEFDDGSCYYFNQEKSPYHSDGKPSNPEAKGRSTYISPKGVKFITPATEDEKGGKYFRGKWWDTDFENVYFRDRKGNVARTPRKNVDADSLPEYTIGLVEEEDGTTHLVQVNDQGVPIEDGFVEDLEETGNTEVKMEEEPVACMSSESARLESSPLQENDPIIKVEPVETDGLFCRGEDIIQHTLSTSRYGEMRFKRTF